MWWPLWDEVGSTTWEQGCSGLQRQHSKKSAPRPISVQVPIECRAIVACTHYASPSERVSLRMLKHSYIG